MSKSKLIVNTISRLHLVEGVAGLYAYHLSVTGANGQATLCGSTNVMSSGVPFTSWNSEPGHIRMKFCGKCHGAAKRNGFNIKEATEGTLVFDAVVKPDVSLFKDNAEELLKKMLADNPGNDNYGRPKADYIHKIAAMDNKKLEMEANAMIYQSARCNNNPRADWHWMVDLCMDESDRRIDDKIYERAYNKCVKEHGGH